MVEARGWTRPRELAAWMDTSVEYLTRRYLGPMTKDGLLVRRYPGQRSRRDQAYRSARHDAAPEAEAEG